jgi:hypothetical protein
MVERAKNMVNLKHDELPTQWYNILPDLPEPLPPPQDPKEGPSRLKNLPNLMIGECLRQEFSSDRWIDIPGGVMDLYAKAGRPRPLFRASGLEKRLIPPGSAKSEFLARPEATRSTPLALFLRQRTGLRTGDHGDRCGPMGNRARLCSGRNRAQMHRLLGAERLRLEKGPFIIHETPGRGSPCLAQSKNEIRPVSLRQGP